MALPDGTMVVVADDAMQLDLFPGADASFPQNWTCDLRSDFTPPGAVGRPAPFTGRGNAAQKTSLLAMATPDWLLPTQMINDLNLTLVVEGLGEPFRAYSRRGQHADLTLIVQNTGPAGRQVTLYLSALADGWRLEPAQSRIDVAAGGSATLGLPFDLLSMASPVGLPHVRVVAQSSGQRTAANLRVPGPDRPGTRAAPLLVGTSGAARRP